MPCRECIHNDVCYLHEDNFMDSAKKNGFCGKFKNNTGGWIKVTDKLPEDVYGRDREQITVLVYTKSKKVSQCSRCAEYIYDSWNENEGNIWKRTGKFYWNKGKKVTYWQPLPEPPESQ